MSHSLNSIDKKVETAKRKVEVGGIYFHYKSPKKYYVVESLGLLEESEDVCVVYRALYGKGIVWVRILGNFLSEVDGEKRFQKA